MYFLALAADYDGTVAHHGKVDGPTSHALHRLKASGRRLILVTGRELPDLKALCPELDLFDRIVAENGGVIFDPVSGTERVIAPPPAADLVARLQQRNVRPISVGRTIVATWEPHETAVLEVIRELGLELQIIFNKGAVMVLPPGVNKASGLHAALIDLDLSFHNVVGVGDAENDHAFLRACGCAATVANALPAVQAEADVRLTSDHGAGVVELIDRLIREDVRMAPPARHGIRIGRDRSGQEIAIAPFSGSVLVVGPSECGKSRLATALTETMAEKAFQFCVVDPEGDYKGLEHAVGLGDSATPPAIAEPVQLLRRTDVNVVLDVQALPQGERQGWFAELLAEFSGLRRRTGRPHWLIVDEAHQFLPAGPGPAQTLLLTPDLRGAVFISLQPEALSRAALDTVGTVIAFGPAAAELLARFQALAGCAHETAMVPLQQNEILYWSRASAGSPLAVIADRPHQAHQRHAGKYAEGDVGEQRSFYFRGPRGALNLRAQNLSVFADLARGLDDAVWQHHLRAGDYSAWFRHVVKDDTLAQAAAAVERDLSLGPAESRRRILRAIVRRIPLPSHVQPA
jgi:HAD superfamily hydrolase (TIGR01484 family)